MVACEQERLDAAVGMSERMHAGYAERVEHADGILGEELVGERQGAARRLSLSAGIECDDPHALGAQLLDDGGVGHV